jgi:hypothetical protein
MVLLCDIGSGVVRGYDPDLQPAYGGDDFQDSTRGCSSSFLETLFVWIVVKAEIDGWVAKDVFSFGCSDAVLCDVPEIVFVPIEAVQRLPVVPLR